MTSHRRHPARERRRSSPTRPIRRAWIAASWIFVGLGLAGCESQGPFEEAGEEIDQAADEIEDEIDQAF